jgi:acyl dehydratase
MSGFPIEVGMTLETANIAGLLATEIAEYAAVSGDNNPVHTDPLVAQNAGLEGIPVQGMFVMAIVANNLGKWPHCKSIRKLTIRFVAPALAAHEMTLTAKVMVAKPQHQTAILRVFLHQRDKVIAMGEAEINVGNPNSH